MGGGDNNLETSADWPFVHWKCYWICSLALDFITDLMVFLTL